MTDREVKRQYRVVDQMLSMHSALRDRYARRGKALTLGILGCSVLLCTVTFLPDDALNPIDISPSASRFLIGGFSSIVFFLSLLGVLVNWGDVSRQHGEAAQLLARLKHKYRKVLRGDVVDPDACAALSDEFVSLTPGLPRIPESQFTSLKADHLLKIRLSQMIDTHAGCPVWLLRLRLMWQGIRGGKDGGLDP